MKNTKLIALLLKLNKEEMSALKSFLQSPYFNHSKRVIELFNVLFNEYPIFQETKIEKSKIFKKIFGYKPYNEALLRNIVSDLFSLCEQFIASEMIKKDTIIKTDLVNKFYSEKELFTLSEKIINESRKELTKVKHQDSDYFFWNFKMFQNSFSNEFNLKYRGNLNKLYKKVDLEKLIFSLDDYYLSELGILIGELRNSYVAHGMQINSERYIKRINFFLEEENLLNPVVAFRLKHCKMLLTENESMYAEVKQEFLKLSKFMDTGSKLSTIVELNGFASSKAWKGDKFFLNEIDEIVLIREKKNLILDENNKINPIAFWNFCNSKIRKSGKKEALAFINKYKKYLPESSAEETVEMVYAALAMHEKRFEQAIAILIKINKPFFSSEISLRRMMLKCYFETKQWRLLLNYLENTKKFIQNNTGKITPLMLDSLKKYCDLLNHMYRYTEQSDVKSKIKLLEILEEKRFPYEEAWIKSKLEQAF